MPKLDPNLVLWFTVIADIFCILASATAAYASVRLWIHKLKEIRNKL